MNQSRNVIAALYADRSPDSPLFRKPDGSVVVVGDALSMVRRLASALHACGVRPADRVSLRLPKSLDAILLAQACLWVGAILHPLNDAYTAHELANLLRDAQPRLFVTAPEEYEVLRPIAEGIHARVESFSEAAGSLRALIDDRANVEAAEPSPPAGDAVLIYTSGTTGKPKGALITHGNLLTCARRLAGIWQIRKDDILLHALPIYHAHGLLTSINVVMAGGGSILLLPSFDLPAVRRALGYATVMMGVPTHYARLIDDPQLPEAIGKDFRLAISGSAPLPVDIGERFRQLTQIPVIERYGSTEAAIITAVPPGTENRAGWVGWALPGVEIRVATPEGVKTSGIGVVETRGENIFAGYWQNDAATAAAFTPDGWFITGDIGEIDAAGCLRLLGREKDIVISGGLNVYPSEVELELRHIPGIKEAAVFGVPHPDFGEAVVAAVELASGATLDEAGAIKKVRSHLAGYKTPKRIVVVDEIPRNTLGKILKARLRADFSRLFAP